MNSIVKQNSRTIDDGCDIDPAEDALIVCIAHPAGLITLARGSIGLSIVFN
jgi:hypothetical protein